MSISPTTVIVRADQPLSAPVGDGLVLFSLDTSKYYAFDEITTAIWERIAAPTTVAELCRTLQEEFDVSPAQCESDVLELLDALHARGLVSIVVPESDAPSPPR